MIGSSPALGFVGNNKLIALYQDSTRNDLLMNIRDNERWLEEPVVIESNGAVGYSNSLEIQQNEALIGTVKFVTDIGGRDLSQILFIPVNLSGY